jgi:hypothetical protein
MNQPAEIQFLPIEKQGLYSKNTSQTLVRSRKNRPGQKQSSSTNSVPERGMASN